MNVTHSYNIKKYVFWAIIAGLFILSALILRPFIVALISAFILAYLVKPIHKFLANRVNETLSAIICIIILIGILILPLTILAGSIISQINLSQSIDLNQISEKISSSSLLGKLDLNYLKESVLTFLLSLLTSAISFIPYLILSTLITIVGVYYILMNWDFLSTKLESLLPFKDKKRVRSEISNITRSIVFGYLLIAFLEFIVAIVGFSLAGVKAFLILSSLIALFAFIPGVGPGIIWIPTALYYLISNEYGTAIGVLITGLFISIVIETLLLGRIVGKKSKIQPLIFLLGVLGGVPLFGIFGFIVGPLILVYSIKLIEESLKEN